MKKKISIIALVVSISMSLCSCGLVKSAVKYAVKNSKEEIVDETQVSETDEVDNRETEIETETETETENEIENYSEYECEYTDYELSGVAFAVPPEYILSEETENEMYFENGDEGCITINISEEFDENVKSWITLDNFDTIVKDTVTNNMNFDEVEKLGEGLNNLDNVYVYNYTFLVKDDENSIQNATLYISCIYISDINRLIYYTHIVDNSKYDIDRAYYESLCVLGSIVGPYIDEDLISSDKGISKSSEDGVSPELVEFLDQYESITDKYMEYMSSMSSGNFDIGDVLSGYSDIISEYEEFSKKAEAYDTSNMSDVDAAYYTKRMLEITSKMYSSLGQFQNK